MTIIIKEILVRTIVERDSGRKEIAEEQLRKMTDRIYRQLKEELQRETRKKGER